MSYLVLARKYRPQTFSEVVGQEHVTRTLGNAFASGRVHHAFLLCGPRGVGKTTLARILGKALNCQGPREGGVPGPTAEPCGECEPCRTIAGGTAVDYMEMDGASNRGIDAMRDLTEAVRYQPAALRKKVYVIDEVHMLTTEAFNALLKTLEEPPPHVTFVLATTEPHKVPVTILSRCQRYDFKLVPVARLSGHLRSIFEREGIQVAGGAVDLIVRESGGSVRDALSLSDQVISFVGGQEIAEAQVAEVLGVADRALTRTLVDAVAAGDAAAALAAVDGAVARGLDEVQLARALTRALHQIAVAQTGRAPLAASSEAGPSSDAEQSDLAELARTIEPTRVRLMCDRMLRACEDLGETSEPRIVLDLALIDLSRLEPLPPLSRWVERLVALEGRLGGGGPSGPSGRSGPTRSSGGASRSQPRSAASAGDTAPAEPPPSAAIPIAESTGLAAGSGSVSVSAPEPVSPPAPESVSPAASASQDPLAAWESVIGALEAARELSLMSIYHHAKVLSWSPRAIEVGFPPGMTADLATEPEKVDAMRRFLEKHHGHPVQLEVVILSDPDAAGAARSLLEAEADRAREEAARRQLEAREHPLTKVVLDTFGASIKEIKTDV